ncbi:hypothetical protein LCGC14_2566960, partial [marine sediment metagenome]
DSVLFYAETASLTLVNNVMTETLIQEMDVH